MPDHVPFVDNDVSQANRVTAEWLNGINDAAYGPYPVGTLGAELASTASASAGDALVGVKSTLAGTQGTTQHEVNERVRHIFDWMTPVQQAAARSNLAVTDLTTPLQAAIDSGESLDFGNYAMAITKLTFDQNGKTYRFGGTQLLGISPSPEIGIIDWQAAYCVVYGMNIVGRWNANYSGAIHWHSQIGAPAKSNHFYDLVINNSLTSIIFGQLSPAVPVDQPQSENYIFGMRTRGVERVVYCNQPNGFLQFVGCEVVSSKSEWDIENPGVYSFTRACVAEVLQGVVTFADSDLVKADTFLGAGLKNSGGNLHASGCKQEIACQVLDLGGGYTQIDAMPGGYWGNAATSWCGMSGNNGVLRVNSAVINKAAAAAAADTAAIDFAGHTGWDVQLTDWRFENQLNWIFANTSAQRDRWSGNTVRFANCTAPPTAGAGAANTYQLVVSNSDNLLDLRGTDTSGNDIATWFKRDISGVGAIALNADVPTLAAGSFPNSIMVTPAVTTGSSEVISLDLTSLTTVKATGIKCRPGETYWMKGWVRMTTAGTAQFTITYANAAGAASSSASVATSADLLTSSWKYIEGWFVVPAVAAYFGVGVRGSAGTVCRIVGVSVTRVN